MFVRKFILFHCLHAFGLVSWNVFFSTFRPRTLCMFYLIMQEVCFHDDVVKWGHFPRYWPFVRGIHRSPVNSPHKGQWRGALMFSFICVWRNGWVNNCEVGNLRRHRSHYGVTVMHYICNLLNFRQVVNFLVSVLTLSDPSKIYRQISNVSRTKS